MTFMKCSKNYPIRPNVLKFLPQIELSITLLYLKDFVCYFWAYNNIQAAFIVISCSFQNVITQNDFIFIPSNILCFCCLYILLLSCTVFHIFNPMLTESNTIWKKIFCWYNIYTCFEDFIFQYIGKHFFNCGNRIHLGILIRHTIWKLAESWLTSIFPL